MYRHVPVGKARSHDAMTFCAIDNIVLVLPLHRVIHRRYMFVRPSVCMCVILPLTPPPLQVVAAVAFILTGIGCRSGGTWWLKSANMIVLILLMCGNSLVQGEVSE